MYWLLVERQVLQRLYIYNVKKKRVFSKYRVCFHEIKDVRRGPCYPFFFFNSLLFCCTDWCVASAPSVCPCIPSSYAIVDLFP